MHGLVDSADYIIILWWSEESDYMWLSFVEMFVSS